MSSAILNWARGTSGTGRPIMGGPMGTPDVGPSARARLAATHIADPVPSTRAASITRGPVTSPVNGRRPTAPGAEDRVAGDGAEDDAAEGDAAAEAGAVAGLAAAAGGLLGTAPATPETLVTGRLAEPLTVSGTSALVRPAVSVNAMW